jgi:hypothetical protein
MRERRRKLNRVNILKYDIEQYGIEGKGKEK